MDRAYLEHMRVHVDEGGKLNHRNGVDLLAEIERRGAEIDRLRKLEAAAKAYIEWWDSDDDGQGGDKREALRAFASEKRDGGNDG